MKLLFGIFIVCLFVSCGKYKKPFITFKSPEKRLTETTWRCIKAVDTDGNEFEVFDHLDFSIDGSDSTFTRISDNPTVLGYNNQSSKDTLSCKWTWAYALGDNFNKQILKQINNPGKIYRVISLSKKVLVLEDQSVDNTIYHYAPL
ncbi:hypothetical protein OAH04_01715 [Crocinitomicaceae bacterium]|nr:hypothetical protein [Crocinitomicaceae bacterium]